MMHFTIPETIERKDANGTPYTVSRMNVLIKNYQGKLNQKFESPNSVAVTFRNTT